MGCHLSPCVAQTHEALCEAFPEPPGTPRVLPPLLGWELSEYGGGGFQVHIQLHLHFLAQVCWKENCANAFIYLAVPGTAKGAGPLSLVSQSINRTLMTGVV